MPHMRRVLQTVRLTVTQASLSDRGTDERMTNSYAAAGVVTVAMEFVPRITRAQVMDALSSQANLAGYRAVIEGAEAYGRVLPMMMTAAGTVAAAKIFIMGVGVAGLQAIATARRLGVMDALALTKVVASRSGDEEDAFIPLMAWFVIESHCARDREAVLALFEDAAFQRSPLVAKHLLWRLMRRFAEAGTRREWVACATLLDRAPGAAEREALMQGFGEAFQGRSLPVLPDELLKALAAGGQMTLTMRVRQGEPAAMKEALAAHQVKMGQLAPAVRVLVCGRAQTPSIDAVLELFPREVVLHRLPIG